MSIPIADAGLDESHRRRRERIEDWIDERARATKPKNKIALKTAKDRLLAQAESEAAGTLLNRLVLLRQLEAVGLSKPPVLTGGWKSKGYREFLEFGRALCADGAGDATEGFSTLLQLVFDELAVDLPGVFGDIGLTRLFEVPAATLRDIVESLDEPALASAWTDDTTLGWVYQSWNDFERDALDEKALTGAKIEPHEIAAKTQMFTDRYIAEWLLQNSLGLIWCCICRKRGWIPDAERILTELEGRRAEWRKAREAGEVALDALMPIEAGLESEWKYFLLQPIPEDAVASAPDSVRLIKLLDPAVGSGHFLVIAFGLLASLYREEARHRGEPVTDREIAESIVENNLHGIDIDPRAIQIAAAALYLKSKSFAKDARPKRMNLVAPILQIGNLPSDDPSVVHLRANLKLEVGIPEELTNRLLTALAGVDYLGSLLKVDAAVDDAIRTIELELSIRREGDTAVSKVAGPTIGAAKASIIDKLEAFLTAHSTSEDLGLRLDGEQLAAGVRFVRMAQERAYDLVVGNPPYQGLAKTESFGYVAKMYPRGKADLCTAFLERGLEFARPGGLLAMVAMRGWLSLGQFIQLRRHLLHTYELRCLGDLDRGAFETMTTSQLISVAMTVFRVAPPAKHKSIALQPTAPGEKYWGPDRTALKRAAILVQRGRFAFDPKGFTGIDGEPVIYWWSPKFLEWYANTPKLGLTSPAWQGVATTNNARFIRRPHEVRPERCGAALSSEHPKGSAEGAEWVPYIKGAPGWKWIEPLLNVIRWGHKGFLLNLHLECYQEAHPALHLKDNSKYFVPGIAFTTVGSVFGARSHRFRSVIGDVGSSVFPDDIASVLCSMNRRESCVVLEALNPTLHFQVGDVNRLPLFIVESAERVYATLEKSIAQHEAAREPSVEFKRPGTSSWQATQDWAQLAVDREAGPLSEYAPIFSDAIPIDFLSFAIGVALGRFDANGGGVLSQAPEGALPAGCLFVSIERPDALDHHACAQIHAAWKQFGAMIGGATTLAHICASHFFSPPQAL